jgi:hypothetical protein
VLVEWISHNVIMWKKLSSFGYNDCKPTPTPYDANMILWKNKRIMIDQSRLPEIISSLMYLASATKPNISFNMSKLSWFVLNSRDKHQCAIERVLHYPKGIMSHCFHYTRYPRVLEGYNDSNWISNADDIKVTSGYMFTLGGDVVSWKSYKLAILLTRSIMELKLISLDIATIEA